MVFKQEIFKFKKDTFVSSYTYETLKNSSLFLGLYLFISRKLKFWKSHIMQVMAEMLFIKIQ